MSTRSDALKKRMIRRHELRQIVPLADTTIYEMEQRGEFPRRFALTPRCVVWDLAEVEAWLNAHAPRVAQFVTLVDRAKKASAPNAAMLAQIAGQARVLLGR